MGRHVTAIAALSRSFVARMARAACGWFGTASGIEGRTSGAGGPDRRRSVRQLARPGGRAGGSRGRGPAGPGETRSGVAGLSRRRSGMTVRDGRVSGVPVQAVLRDHIGDMFFRASVSSSVRWGLEADRSTRLMGSQLAHCASARSAPFVTLSSVLAQILGSCAGGGPARRPAGLGSNPSSPVQPWVCVFTSPNPFPLPDEK